MCHHVYQIKRLIRPIINRAPSTLRVCARSRVCLKVATTLFPVRELFFFCRSQPKINVIEKMQLYLSKKSCWDNSEEKSFY